MDLAALLFGYQTISLYIVVIYKRYEQIKLNLFNLKNGQDDPKKWT